MQPTSDRVLVQLEPLEESKRNGIILLADKHKMLRRGEVLAVGPGKISPKNVRLPMSVRVGDTVTIHANMGVMADTDNPDRRIVRDTDIVLVHE